MSAQVWSTAPVPAPEQFHFWRDVVWDAFVPVALSRDGDGPFHGTVSGGRVGPLGIFRISSDAQGVARTTAHIARRAGDVFFLNLPLTEGSWARQDGRVAELPAGSFSIVDGARPFTLGFGAGFDQVTVTIPHDLLIRSLADPTAATAITVAGDHGIGALVAGALRSLAVEHEHLDHAHADAVAHWATGMVALATGEVTGRVGRSHHRRLLAAATDAIEHRLDDPSLAPGTVASQLGVSTRQLQRLFAERGTTFGMWVLHRRVERCYEDLVNPALVTLGIAEIGARHGLPDPAYLSRVFKAQYAVPPRELRRRMLRAQWSPLDK